MISAAGILRRAYGMFARVFPRCGVISQATAFNPFLACFPALPIAVALATSRIGGRTSLFDLIADLTQFLPPGSQGIVSQFLVKRGPEAWKIAALGWTGTLLAGSQVMKLVMQGIHTIYGDTEKLGFLHRQIRGLMLLLVTIAPLLGAAVLGVLGKPLRRWIAHEIGKHNILQGWSDPEDPIESIQREVERLFHDLVYHRHPASHFSEPSWQPAADLVVSQ